MDNIDILMVKYEDVSTNRVYISQVADVNEYDNDKPITTALEAMAWKSQMTLKEYIGLEIEA